MRAACTLFQGNIPRHFERLANVLRLSAQENSPNTPLTIYEITDPDQDIFEAAKKAKPKGKWIDNARKAKHHNRIIQEARNGERICFLDADTLVLGDLSDAIGELHADWDLAITFRPNGARWKLNTGVYFVTVSERTKQLSARWYEIVLEMLQDKMLHDKWRSEKSYGGIHQAALGYMMESGLLEGTNLARLECQKWNCASFMWDQFNEDTRVVHIMGNLRDCCLGKSSVKDDSMRRLAKIWKSYDQRVRAA